MSYAKCQVCQVSMNVFALFQIKFDEGHSVWICRPCKDAIAGKTRPVQDLSPEVTEQWGQTQVTIQLWAGHAQVVTVKIAPPVNGSKSELTGTDSDTADRDDNGEHEPGDGDC